MNGKIYWTAFAVLVATPMSNLAMVVTKIQKPGDVLRPAEGLTHFVPLDDGAEVQFYRYTKPNSRVPSRKEVNMDLTQSEYDEKYHELNPSGSTVDDMALNHSNGEVYYRLKSIQSIEEGSEQAAQVLNLKNKATENGSGVWAVKNHAGETIRCKAKLRSEPKWTFDQNILSGKIASTGLHEDEALKVEVSYPPKTEIQKKNRFRSLLNRSASLLNLNTQKNKRANSHDSQLFRDENLIDHRSIDDLLDHQRSYLIINHQVSSLTPNKYHLINKNKQYLNLANNSSRCYSQELLYQQKVKHSRT
ncbi:hypothetical protein PSTT_07215 [Puccinia striiformis]|uniref:Uncharacterized protein n=3 Tax=Puccinia striiformis TaxID=27350 RepID=A0A2S4VHD2_9BASI|nr:hypothetical protein PSTT_07215 [Puccinia striiformis]